MMIDNGEWAVDAAMAERAEKDARRSEHARCKHCGHAAYAHGTTVQGGGSECVACGCIKFEARPPRDESTLRQWIVTVEFFTKNRWVKGEARVRAAGQVGAVAKGLREVKRAVVKPRARVGQIKIGIVPVPQKKGGK
jgi:hypothetical protein